MNTKVIVGIIVVLIVAVAVALWAPWKSLAPPCPSCPSCPPCPCPCPGFTTGDPSNIWTSTPSGVWTCPPYSSDQHQCVVPEHAAPAVCASMPGCLGYLKNDTLLNGVMLTNRFPVASTSSPGTVFYKNIGFTPPAGLGTPG